MKKQTVIKRTEAQIENVQYRRWIETDERWKERKVRNNERKS